MEDRILNATHEGDLLIGSTVIPSAVLEDGQRVLISKGFLTALGRPWRGTEKGTELPNFIAANNLKPFISNELREVLNPIKFKPLKGRVANGYKAELLPLVCEVYLKARDANVIGKNQEKTTFQADLLIRSLSKVGIVALVDEATGYQESRDRYELQKLLALYISEELLPWAKVFPDEFYKQIFRLKNWQYNPLSSKRPRLIGKLTNEVVYERLPKGVLEELKKLNPVINENGYRKYKFHQHLTEDIGNIHLKNHLIGVIALMKASASWPKFRRMLERAYPKPYEQLSLEIDD